MSKYLKQHEAILADANAKQELVIAAVRTELLIPFCNRTKMRFTAGMGSWSFDKPNRWRTAQDYFGDPDDVPGAIPKTLIDFLCTDSGLSRNDLGSLMEDYTPPGWTRFDDKVKK